ncbi:MAG: methyltransferase domain-containing protein [Hyphomicrobium sp.]|nr:methyltransferase domain-containing protein [Hyphomicrobium sp.]
MGDSQTAETAGLLSDYERWRSSELGRITDHIEEEVIVALVEPVFGKRVLDVGCGDGLLSARLAQEGAQIIGIDNDPRMLDAARRRAGGAKFRPTFVGGSAEALPFPDGLFDIVVAITVLCLLSDPEKAFREMSRVLRPGGRIVIGELGRHSLWAAKRRVAGWFGSITWRSARFRTSGDLKELAQAAGLEVEAIRGAVYYPPCNRCARWLARFDRRLSRLTTFGAAFVALAARKPHPSAEVRP